VAVRFRAVAGRTALLLGCFALLLTLLSVPLAVWAHQLSYNDLSFAAGMVPFAIVGFVLARRVPGNPIGWILLLLALSALFGTDAGLYAVRAVGLGDRGLPLARVAVFLAVGWVWMLVLMPLPIALFPDGRLPSRRLQWTLPAYVLLCAVLVAGFASQDITGIGAKHLRIDSSGELAAFGTSPTGWARISEHVVFPVYACFCLTWLISQLLSYRRANGERRQQLKWLLAGGTVCLVGIAVGIAAGNTVVSDIGWISIVALPAGIGVGVLKYRLYDIDRLISRTLSYLIVTGILAGVFVAVVVVATDVLPFSSPVAVAASTLAAAALFNPIRRRTQQLVDRRFNRTRYDTQTTVAAFSGRLRNAVDPDTIRTELVHAVDRAVSPSYVSLWIRPSVSTPRQST
jgi:hypothetical protein